MEEEIESMRKNPTWMFIDIPRNQKVVGCKWLFKKNEGILGVERYRFKARLAGNGLHK